jgi:DNA-binding CsgD family transcriptional regulator
MAVVALEIRDIDRAVDFAGQARSTAARYELPVLETEATAISCRARWWGGDWTGAEDLAADVLGRKAKSDIHVAAALGTIRMRTGRSGGDNLIEQAWALATESDEIDHLLASATALAERMWIEGRPDEDRLERFGELVERGVRSEYPWPAGSLALWLWKLGKLDLPTSGLPEPYRRLSEGDVEGAAESWRILKIPYERAATLMSGDQEQRLQSLELLESLGASVPASRVRQELRADGITPPRGRGRATRGNRAGLTARQAEVLQLLAAGLSNVEIADRLFVSPRTIETHVSAVMGKLGCSSRTEAVATAHREGLIAG